MIPMSYQIQKTKAFKRNEESHLVVDGAAAVLEDDLADGVGGGEQGVVGEAVGGEDPVEVGHQGGGELRLCHQQDLLSDNCNWSFCSEEDVWLCMVGKIEMRY